MRLPRPVPVTTGIATLLLAAGASAATLPAEERRFEELIQLRQGGVIAVAPQKMDDLAPGDPLRQGWNEFRGRHAGRWSVYLDERSAMPTLVSGPGVELLPAGRRDAASLSDVENAVRGFVETNATILGDWKGLLVLDADASGELREGHWQLVFRQAVDGVTVENSRLDFHVVGGKLTMFGSSNWAAPTVSGSAEDRRRRSPARSSTPTWASTPSKFESAGEPELVLLALDAGAGIRPAPKLGRPAGDRDWATHWSGGCASRTPTNRPSGSARSTPTTARCAPSTTAPTTPRFVAGSIPSRRTSAAPAEGCEFDGLPMPFARL